MCYQTFSVIPKKKGVGATRSYMSLGSLQSTNQFMETNYIAFIWGTEGSENHRDRE